MKTARSGNRSSHDTRRQSRSQRRVGKGVVGHNGRKGKREKEELKRLDQGQKMKGGGLFTDRAPTLSRVINEVTDGISRIH